MGSHCYRRAGHLAAQVTKLKEATVIGAAGAGNHEFLQQLGVDQRVDYRSHNFTRGIVQSVKQLVI
jgi:NADPH-dependent curcumin reductase CurA